MFHRRLVPWHMRLVASVCLGLLASLSPTGALPVPGPAAPGSAAAVSLVADSVRPPELARPLGEHVLLEAVAASADKLDDVEFVRDAVAEACRLADLTVVFLKAHRFAPQGVSVVAVLAESHLSVHTWPELGYAAIDAYTCGLKPGQEGRALKAATHVAERVQAEDYHVSTVARGIPTVASLREAARLRAAQRDTKASAGGLIQPDL